MRPALDGMELRPGTIALGPGDRHLLIMNGIIRVGRGSRENRHRPSAELVPLSCPECGGGLWRSSTGPLHYRCHTGHAFSPDGLLSAQSEEVERALYVALRVLEERVSLLEQMGPHALGPGHHDRLAEAKQEVELLRRVLMGEG